MTTIYNIDAFTRGVNGFGLPFCDTVFSATLAANTDTTIAVPLTMGQGMPAANLNNKFIAVVCVGVHDAHDTYIAINAVAAVPAGGNFAATTSEIIPNNQLYGKYCKSGDTIHFISPGTPDISVAFYAILD